MAASSNFGNRFSVVGASAFLPFLPIPFLQSRASWPLILSSVIIVAVGAWLTVSPLANILGFVPLPPLYWLLLAVMLLGYTLLTQGVKSWFIRRFDE